MYDMVGEHSIVERRVNVSLPGRDGRENAGMSNDKIGEKPIRQKTKVS